MTAVWAVGTLTTRAEPSRGRRRGCKDRPWASPATTSPGGSCTPTVRQSPAMCLPYRIPPNSQRPERFIDEKTKTRGGKATGPPPPQGTLGNYDTLGCHSWGGMSISRVEARDAAKYPATHRPPNHRVTQTAAAPSPGDPFLQVRPETSSTGSPGAWPKRRPYEISVSTAFPLAPRGFHPCLGTA